MRSIVILIALLGLIMTKATAVQAQETSLAAALKAGGHVILMRHALAPGGGDPANFQLRDCSTQRNLSDAGRDQARRIGAQIRKAADKNIAVLSSQWCRCLETARLLGLGSVTELPAINSFFQRWENRDPQTGALRQWLRTAPRDKLHVLVTHQVNITAMTDVFPQSGEMVVLKVSEADGAQVVGRVTTAH